MRTRRIKPRTDLSAIGESFAHTVTGFAGSSLSFVIALSIVLFWAALGPLFGFSDTWQLVINTGTTIVTFLMVFLIQRSQNKDSLAIELKLNEIVGALEGASNRLVNVEDLSEEELTILHRRYQSLVEQAKREGSLLKSHSVDEAEEQSAKRHSNR